MALTFIVADTGKWPYILNMEGKYQKEPKQNFYEVLVEFGKQVQE